MAMEAETYNLGTRTRTDGDKNARSNFALRLRLGSEFERGVSADEVDKEQEEGSTEKG